NRLLRIVMPLATPLGCWLSVPRMLTPAATWRITLFVNWTCCTVHQVHVPFWLRGVNRTAHPTCAPSQLYSSTLPSMRTRCAFLSSRMFLTFQLCVRQATCLVR